MSVQEVDRNENIRQFLRFYCDHNNHPGFAVLLKGEWGCGKTWFIQNFIASAPNPMATFNYVSLYGVQSLADIDLFVYELRPLSTASVRRKLGGILEVAAAQVGTKLELLPALLRKKRSKESVLKQLKLGPKFVLVLDDFERCAVPINDMLGYINQLVEHAQIKVIILSHEDKNP